MLLIGVITPVALGFVLVQELRNALAAPYGDYPTWLVATMGWGVAIGVVAVAVVVSLLPWSRRTSLDPPLPLADATRPVRKGARP